MNPLRSLGIVTALIGGTGALSGAAQSAINLFKIRVSELLEFENKFTLLSDDDIDSWNNAWEAYQLNNWDKKTDEWNIKDWKTKSVAPEEFKNMCKYSLNTRINGIEDPRYENIVSYCTRPKKLSEAFKTAGIKLLDVRGDIDPWIDKYKDNWKYVDLLPLPKGDVVKDSYDRLAAGCWALGNIETTNIDYDNAIEIAKFLCAE